MTSGMTLSMGCRANISPGCSQSALDAISVRGAVQGEPGRVAVACRACLAFLETAGGQLTEPFAVHSAVFWLWPKKTTHPWPVSGHRLKEWHIGTDLECSVTYLGEQKGSTIRLSWRL